MNISAGLPWGAGWSQTQPDVGLVVLTQTHLHPWKLVLAVSLQ